MQHTIHFPRTRSRSTRKRLAVWTITTIFAAGIGFMAGLTTQAIDAEGMRSLYLQQIDDMQAEINHLKALPEWTPKGGDE